MDSLRTCLQALKYFVELYGVKEISMPRIGCGYDRLQWWDVRHLLTEIFHDTDITINVYYLFN